MIVPRIMRNIIRTLFEKSEKFLSFLKCVNLKRLSVGKAVWTVGDR